MKNLWVAADHAGFELKSQLINSLQSISEITTHDLGTYSKDSVDYPDFANLVCQKISENPEDFGLLICGSGQGMAIRANKFPKIRAALCWNTEIAELSRAHNNANILCLGSRFLTLDQAIDILSVFIKTSFEGGRHQNRVQKIHQPC